MAEVMPNPDEIKAARKAASLTQSEAGRIVYVSARGWQDWERGVRPIDMNAWENFLRKTKAARRRSGV